jgi:hypothetical protein
MVVYSEHLPWQMIFVVSFVSSASHQTLTGQLSYGRMVVYSEHLPWQMIFVVSFVSSASHQTLTGQLSYGLG